MTWDVRGKSILVTGATSGIGYEASVELLRLGGKVTMVGRDAARTEAAAERARAQSGSSEVRHLLCDFSSLSAIRALAAEVRATHPALHVLVNNAGGVNKTRRLTGDGIEATFAVNHLGYFLLTHELRELLVKSAPARVVTVASVGHRRGTIDFEDLGFERGYSIMKAYARSKLANILFANELARQLEGKGVTSNSLHPGAVNTNIWSGAPGWAKPIITLLLKPFFLSAVEGARSIVDLVAKPELDGVSGRYFDKRREAKPAPLALDGALGRRLWEVSARLVGVEGAAAA